MRASCRVETAAGLGQENRTSGLYKTKPAGMYYIDTLGSKLVSRMDVLCDHYQ